MVARPIIFKKVLYTIRIKIGHLKTNGKALAISIEIKGLKAATEGLKTQSSKRRLIRMSATEK